MQILGVFRDWRSTGYSSIRKRPLGAWIAAVTLLHVILVTADAYGGDQSYWKSWITQLQAGGYARLDANYPPSTCTGCGCSPKSIPGSAFPSAKTSCCAS